MNIYVEKELPTHGHCLIKLLAFLSSYLPDLQNEEFLNAYGTFLAENGPREEALVMLQRAVDLFPNHGFEKYM